MSPLLGAITVDTQNHVHHYFLECFGKTAYVADQPGGRLVSSQPIFEHQGIFCTGVTHNLTLNNQPLTPDGLPKAWHQGNIDTLRGLSGEFSILVWDARTQNVWAVRDHFGSDPLHYFHDPDCFAFSHRARPLWDLPTTGVHSINESRILDYIVDDLEHATQTATFKQNIHKVPLAGYANWYKGKVQTHQYWKPDLSPIDAGITNESAIDSFQRLLAASLLNKSGQGNAIALLASGGLDSNAIHAAWKTTKQYAKGNNHLISLLPEKENRDDLECDMLRNEVSRGSPLPHLFITPEKALHKLNPIESFVHQLEDPFTMHTLSGPAPCYQMASEKGASHAMDGIDGDLIGGIPSNYWYYLWASGKRKHAMIECILNHKHHGEPFSKSLKALLRMFLSNDMPGLLRRLDFLSSKRDWDLEQAKRWKFEFRIRDSVFPESCIQQRIQLLRSNHPTPSCATMTDYLHQGMTSPILGVGVDRYAEAAHIFGLKAIHPLLDKDLAEFLLRLPWHFRTKNGKEKSLFRLFLKGNHQKKIANQLKLPHVGSWFTRVYQRDYLKRHPKPKTECLDAVNKYVDATWMLTEWGKMRNNNSADAFNEDLWRMLMLGEWLVQNT